MNMSTRDLSRASFRMALEARIRAKASEHLPLNVFDCCEEHFKVRVQFMLGSSFEGMFSKDRNTILVPSERPPGRRTFAAAHELGHWAFGHGTRIDEEGSFKSPNKPIEERLADRFAGYFLMPPESIRHAATLLDCDLKAPNPIKILELSNWFSVGYGTILNHLTYSLSLLDEAKKEQLIKIAPKTIKESVVLSECAGDLKIISGAAPPSPIDIEVGDFAILPHGASYDHTKLKPIRSLPLGDLVLAEKPGTSLCSGEDEWAAAIRIMRKGYTGWAKYRHLEDESN